MAQLAPSISLPQIPVRHYVCEGHEVVVPET